MGICETADVLSKKFVVCTKHFKGSDYRNEISNFLNTTAIPNLKDNSEHNNRIKPLLKISKSNQTIEYKISIVKPELQDQKDSTKRKPEIRKFEANKKVRIENSPLQEEDQDSDCDSNKSDSLSTEAQEEDANLKIGQADNETGIIVESNETEETYEDIDTVQDKTTQTESLVPNSIEVQTELATDKNSNEMKFIQLMYPEHANIDRIVLIEKLIEMQKKIEILESKNEKMSEVIKSFLE